MIAERREAVYRQWIGLTDIGVVLGLGLSWSLIRARATGQVEVD